jgi:hypothetical protein
LRTSAIEDIGDTACPAAARRHAMTHAKWEGQPMELPSTPTKQTIPPPTRTMAAEALLLHATRVRGNKIASIDEDARRRVVTQSTPLNLKTEVASTCTPALTPDGPNAAPECKPGRTAPPELHIRSPSAYTAQHILVLQGP